MVRRSVSAATCPALPRAPTPAILRLHNWKIVMPGKAEKGEPSACSACHINDKASAPQFSADALQTVIDSRQKETINDLAALDARLKA